MSLCLFCHPLLTLAGSLRSPSTSPRVPPLYLRGYPGISDATFFPVEHRTETIYLLAVLRRNTPSAPPRLSLPPSPLPRRPPQLDPRQSGPRESQGGNIG
ncbi:hypothetical protein GGS23DRAFT_427683 [Durotheca rogersii]|uniref:uncharacterized protein n=1 Tax=Durotheca rogersii TaxID=419775 RepID=UPI00221E9387|nr:uncharacterized protein GGS23DRAFT_427683 [Durotheca rogersii]KAI5865460.1 hypothetical protein GGS23DRAFT_427683 [Durotheca rogersii]